MGQGAGCGNARETSTGAFLTDRGTDVEDPSPRSMKARRFPMVLKALLLMPAAFVPAGDEADTDCGHSRVHAESMERFRGISEEPQRPAASAAATALSESVGAGVQLRFSVERVVVDRIRDQRWYLTAGGAGDLETGMEEPVGVDPRLESAAR